jgi:hypothetical protein
MQERKIHLAFDSEISSEISIEVGVPQGSPISAILFSIYIRYIFELADEEKDEELKQILSEVRIPSYIDDIGISISSKSLKENCRKLNRIAEKIFDKGKENFILFDQEKIDLIHFHLAKKIDENQYQVRIKNLNIKPKKIVKWLGIYLDSKLDFKHHVNMKITQATRVFCQIERLSNTERGLSFQAMRQLYIACVTSIADYGVSI